MKNKKYHNVVTVPKSYGKIAETEVSCWGSKAWTVIIN
jgi:hypothetical protein